MIKKALSIVITFTLVSLICITAFAEDIEDKTFSSILVLGDSISSGYGLEGYPDDKDNIRNYSNLIRDELKPDTFNNLAINGQTSIELLKKVKNGEYDDNIKDADLILITIGGNDILFKLLDSIKEMFKDVDGNYQLAITDKNAFNNIFDKIIDSQDEEEYNKACEDFKTNFIQLTKLINEKNADSKVYFQTVYNPFSGVSYLSKTDEFAQKYTSIINDTIKNNTKDENGNILYEYIDVADFFNLKAFEFTNIFRFDIHPNSTGHQMIYQILSSAINGKQTHSEQALAIAATPLTTQVTTSEITASQETTTVETTLEQTEQIDSKASNSKKILFTAIPSVILISIVFLFIYFKLKRKAK